MGHTATWRTRLAQFLFAFTPVVDEHAMATFRRGANNVIGWLFLYLIGSTIGMLGLFIGGVAPTTILLGDAFVNVLVIEFTQVFATLPGSKEGLGINADTTAQEFHLLRRQLLPHMIVGWVEMTFSLHLWYTLMTLFDGNRNLVGTLFSWSQLSKVLLFSVPASVVLTLWEWGSLRLMQLRNARRRSQD
ncbi:hypothetical protein [Lacticaseibacillus daqingensis]|uniref:hypothetical protein n=1 Tax=Lacticaseibacillus daqingensis TaxID=2486014 RepID=UPI000F79A6C4|nr:hypothetical protein [Lacticaseibacillus daqingensis]